MTAEPRVRAARRPQQLHLLVLGLAVAVTALIVGWLLLKHGSTPTPSSNGPTLVSQAQLERFGHSHGTPVYWAGAQPGMSYELTTASGRTWVRYLPTGVRAGDPRASFLVVGTYQQRQAYADLQRAAKRTGSVSKVLAGGGLLVYNRQRPTSVYFSYPGAAYQVEVFSRSAEVARSLVLNGETTPVR